MDMKTLWKKNATMVTAVICAGAMLGSSGVVAFAEEFEADPVTFAAAAPAATYDPCDVNHDGQVNIMDVTEINTYLLGKRSAIGYNQLDANRNLVVDKEDANYILCKLVKKAYATKYISRTSTNPPTPTVSTPITLDYSTAAIPNGIDYIGYSYEKSKNIEGYKLTPSETPISSQSTSDTNGIGNGADTRYRANGLSEITGVVKLENGVGFIVGDNIIATAASNVYDHEKKVYFDKAKVVPTVSDSTGHFSGKLTPLEVHLPKKYSETGNVEYDYALIKVAEDLKDYYHFTLGSSYNLNSSSFSKIPLYIMGAPNYIGVDPKTGKGSSTTRTYVYIGEGKVINGNATNVGSILHCDTDATRGENGAPMYVLSEVTEGDSTYQQATAIGIFHHNPNEDVTGVPASESIGARVTRYQLQFYYGNSYINNTNEAGTVTE